MSCFVDQSAQNCKKRETSQDAVSCWKKKEEDDADEDDGRTEEMTLTKRFGENTKLNCSSVVNAACCRQRRNGEEKADRREKKSPSANEEF